MWNKWRNLLRGWRQEISPLRVLIWLRLLEEEAPRDLNVHDEKQAEAIKARVSPSQREFVELRVAARLEWYANAVDRINSAGNFISIIVAAGGVLIASLTAIHPKTSSGFSWENYVVIVVGVVVGILGALGPRVVRREQVERYRRGGNRLRAEAWQFALKQGDYSKIDDVHLAFAKLVANVDAIERDAIATEADISLEK